MILPTRRAVTPALVNLKTSDRKAGERFRASHDLGDCAPLQPWPWDEDGEGKVGNGILSNFKPQHTISPPGLFHQCACATEKNLLEVVWNVNKHALRTLWGTRHDFQFSENGAKPNRCQMDLIFLVYTEPENPPPQM
jgi:hypothetical protein